MLYFMRKHAKFFYVFLFLVIISFIFFYVGPVDRNSKIVLAKVGDEKILLDEYWRTYERLKGFYKEVYKEKFDEMEEKLNLKQKTLDTLLEERILLIEARDLGLTVPDDELQEAIMNESAFMRDGVFKRDIYLRTLQLNRLTPAYYESLKRQELLLKKVRSLIEDSVGLTSEDTKDFKGNEQFFEAIRNSLLRDKQEKAVRSYIETLKKSMNVKVNTELIP